MDSFQEAEAGDGFHDELLIFPHQIHVGCGCRLCGAFIFVDNRGYS